MDVKICTEVFEEIIKHDGISVSKISSITGYSIDTIVFCVKYLFDRRLVNWRIGKNSELEYYSLLPHNQSKLKDW